MKLLIVSTLILAACSDPVVMSVNTPPNEPTVIRSEEELRAAVANGAYWLKLEGSIVLSETLDLADVTPGNFFTIEATGGWTGTALVRGFCCGPLIEASRFRKGKQVDWEIRMRGVLFDAQAEKYPNAGPSLYLPYVQLSIFEDLRFQDHPGRPFVLDTVDATEFRDIFLLYNGRSAEIHNASDFRWRGGAIQGTWGKPATGLLITGKSPNQPNSRTGPGLIEDIHMEGALLEVRGVANLTFRGGSYLASEVRLFDVPGLHCAGDGGWKESSILIDGLPANSCR